MGAACSGGSAGGIGGIGRSPALRQVLPVRKAIRKTRGSGISGVAPDADDAAMPCTPRGSVDGLPAGTPNGPDRRAFQAFNAQWTVGNAMSVHGIWSQSNSATSRLSGPEAKCGCTGSAKRPRKITCTWPIRATLNTPRMPSRADSGGRLFHGFARGAFLQRLAKFQVAGGQRPKPAARLDGAAAHQDLAVQGHDGADDDLGVLIVDMAAIGADHALAVVALRDAAFKTGHTDMVGPRATDHRDGSRGYPGKPKPHSRSGMRPVRRAPAPARCGAACA